MSGVVPFSELTGEHSQPGCELPGLGPHLAATGPSVPFGITPVEVILG